MRSLIDLSIVANWISMLRADVDGAIWLVDDDNDGRFYEMCSHPSARVVPSPGATLSLLAYTQDREIKGIVASVRGLSPVENSAENIFCPGLGDVTSLLLVSECFSRAFEEIAGVNWLRAAEKVVGSLRDRAITVAWIFLQITKGTEAQSTPNTIENFIDWHTLDLSVPAIISNFGNESAENIQPKKKLVDQMNWEQMLSEIDGIDVLRILKGATQFFKPRGLQAKRTLEIDDFLGMLRLAFDFANLEKDQIFLKMRRWERQNSQFPLLRPWRLLDPLQVVWDQRYWERDLQLMLKQDIKLEGLTAFKMDLDNFKSVNEQLGHAGGDEAIRIYCRIVRESLAQVAEVYRRGGDEIVAFAPSVRGSNAFALAELVRDQVEKDFISWGTAQGLHLFPTASIGVVDVSPGSSFEEVIRLMDEAQLRAKQEGKNRTVLIECRPDSSCMTNKTELSLCRSGMSFPNYAQSPA